MKHLVIPVILFEYFILIWRFYWCYGDFFVTFEHNLMFAIITTLQILGAWSHRVAMNTNPGFVGKAHFKDIEQGIEYSIQNQETNKCSIKEPQICKVETCRALKVKGVHHCSICNKCIYQMDHHCAWTGNCVGRCNYKYFVLFTFYISFECAVGACFIAKIVLCDAKEKHLEHIELNVVKYYLDCYTYPIRERLVGWNPQSEWFNRNTMRLPDIDPQTNKYVRMNSDIPYTEYDQILFLSVVCWSVYVGGIGLRFLFCIYNNMTFVEMYKLQKKNQLQ